MLYDARICKEISISMARMIPFLLLHRYQISSNTLQTKTKVMAKKEIEKNKRQNHDDDDDEKGE